MARYKKRSFFKRARTKARRYSRSDNGNMVTSLGMAAAYGAGRGYIANFITPYAQKFLGTTLGNVADNVGMLAANYAVHRFVKNKTVRQITKAGMIIEAAQIGQELVSSSLSTGTASSNGYNFG